MIDGYNSGSDEGMNKGFITAYDNFAWLHLRQIVFKNTMIGVLFSVSLSFLVLLFTTRNLFVSLIAIVSICSIIASLLSAIRLMGHQFGLIESTCVVVFIGISFDYVVHICHQYIHSVSLTDTRK